MLLLRCSFVEENVEIFEIQAAWETTADEIQQAKLVENVKSSE